MFLTAPYKHYKRLPGDKLSKFEDGGHVRWGYTHEEITKILNDFGFQVEVKEYITGYISQKLIYLGRLIGKVNPVRNTVSNGVNPKLAWLLIFPFRIFQFLDPFIAKFIPHLSMRHSKGAGFIKHPFLSIGIVATKPRTELLAP